MAIRSQSFSKSSPIEISKSPTSSKNLAHVPCKFFKQGSCQAGNSCPFSHTLNISNDTAPCKYFQKGNCKFGAKCALAHILPDGRRVNPKTLAQVYQNQSITSNGGENYKVHSNGNGYFNSNQSRQADNGNGLNKSPNAIFVSYPNVVSPGSNSTKNMSLSHFVNQNLNASPTYINSNKPIRSQSFAHDSSSNPRRPSNEKSNSFSLANNSIWSTNNINNTSGFNETVIALPSSSSADDGFYRRIVSHSSTFKPSNSYGSFNLNESAILDDYEEDGDEEVYQEDFVPSSLSDLLTPQELQRRGSRPSSSRQYSNFLQLLGKGQNDEHMLESHHSSIEAIVDQIDEGDMQFKMDDDEYYNDVIKNLGSIGLNNGIGGLAS